MTIKRNNQKSSDKNKKDGQDQPQQNCARAQNVVHRFMNTRSSLEHGQSPRRSDIVYEELQCRHRRSPHKSLTKRSEKSNQIVEDPVSVGVTPAVVVTNQSTTVVVNTSDASTIGNNNINNTTNTNTNSSNTICGNNLITPCSSKEVTLGGSSSSTTKDLLQPSSSGISSCSSHDQSGIDSLYNNLYASHLSEMEILNGYNSGDEHLVSPTDLFSLDEWYRRDRIFVNKMKKLGFIVREVAEDGACLFRAISLQIFGDEAMHERIRAQTMDYIFENRGYFKNFVTEDIESYVQRKRSNDSHGNHIEIQAISEIYNRKIELYCYQTKPINTFNDKLTKSNYEPLRLSYQRGSHYNAILDARRSLDDIALDLASYKADLQTKEALKLSEQQEIEQAMFEDKIKSTDWEATNVELVEQIARESYLQYRRETLQKSSFHCDNAGGGDDNKNRRKILQGTTSSSATITSAECTQTNSGSLYTLSSNQKNLENENERTDDDDVSTGGNGATQKKAKNLFTIRLKNTTKKSSPRHDNNDDDSHIAKKKARLEIPSTSRDQSFSEFHQSLIESSYNGCNQLSESEMINKAIQMSRLDFIEEQSKKYGLAANEDIISDYDDDDST